MSGVHGSRLTGQQTPDNVSRSERCSSADLMTASATMRESNASRGGYTPGTVRAEITSSASFSTQSLRARIERFGRSASSSRRYGGESDSKPKTCAADGG